MTTFENIVKGGDGKLLFGIPKKGRLYEKVINIINGAGLDFIRLPRLDIAEVKGLPIRLVFLPAHDIAQYVGMGHCHMGITGEDMIYESGMEDKLTVLRKLGFGKCRLCVQAPQGEYKDASELCGGRIVTSFPNAAKRYFESLDPSKATTVRYVSGSVEVACALGLADAVVDLVETGTTMRAAGLEIVSTIMETESVLICKRSIPEIHATLVDKVIKRINGFLMANEYVMVTYNCPEEKLAEAKKITPGKESPTVTELHQAGWLSVSALIKSKSYNDIMDQLEEIGAKSILMFNVANCRAFN